MSKFSSLKDILEKETKEGQEYYAGGTDNRGGGNNFSLIILSMTFFKCDLLLGSGLAVIGGPGDKNDSANNSILKLAKKEVLNDNNNIPKIRLTLYSNGNLNDSSTKKFILFNQIIIIGFKINDESFRSNEDNDSKEFLNAISAGTLFDCKIIFYLINDKLYM